MSFVNLPPRTTDDSNAAADVTQLMENINVVYEKVLSEILTEIELLEVKSVFCDPLNIPSEYMIADGSAFPSLSEANIIHRTGGVIFEGTLFERTYAGKGLTNIPNVLGQHLRYAALGSTTDPDRDDRRQSVTGTVDLTSGVVVYLPAYYINIIKNAVDNSRPVMLAQLVTTVFDTFRAATPADNYTTIYGTVTTVNTSLNYVVLSSVNGTFTAGSQSLIIKGDIVGSFQRDAIRNITGLFNGNTNDGARWSGAFYRYNSADYGSDGAGGGGYLGFDASRVVPTGGDNRGKNTALLPLVRVYI